MIDFVKVWNWYSRESVQRAIVEAAKDREAVSVFKDLNFGKRPDILQYPQDILQAVAEGTVAFHASVERWNQPMKLDVGMTKIDLDNLRRGWDIFIDPDVKDFEIGKIVTRQIIEALKDHGVTNYSLKFTGGKGFHIGIPFEALPEKINLQPTKKLYPDLLHKVIEYLKWYIKDQLKEEILSLDTPINLSKRIGKPLKDITNKEGIEPFKIISMDLFGSRHLFRLPHSLHEKTSLVSLPLELEDLDKFEKEDAKPERAKIKEKFLISRFRSHDAEALIIEALDWASKYEAKEGEKLPKPKKMTKTRFIPEKFFPPCIIQILNGLADGRKRSVFILVNFLRNVGWDLEKIEKKLEEWNEKNQPSLRRNYLRSQLRWHFRQNRSLLPPNCDNPNFYQDIKVCNPDKTCKAWTEKISIKNPVTYPFKKLKKTKKLR
jgi:hypothetical protein